MDSDNTLYILSGCTAVGKTEIALGWAERNNAEIISCDSLLFYRGMDIGTAKPTAADQERIRHHLIDICEPGRPMDISRYLELAQGAVEGIQNRGKRVLVTGGSGFYLKAFFAPVIDDTPVSEEIRERVSAIEETQGLEGLVKELETASPNCANYVDTANPRRVSKALERCLSSGLNLSELRERFAQQSNPLVDAPKRWTLLEREKAALNARIKQRIGIMLQDGLIEEVAALRENGLEQNPSAASAIGYRETIALLDGELPQDELAPLIAQNTRRLAKKQRTWFRSQLPEPHKVDLSAGNAVDLDTLFAQA